MADTKATGLSPFTPVLTDIVYGVDDPGGTPVSGKLTLQSVMDLFEANMAAPASAISSGTFADARIAASNVTQHEAALTVTESQISDLGSYLTSVSLDGISDVTLTTAAQGDILYRNASGWVNLPAGTSGQYLQTQGAGANPQWAAGAGGGISNVVEDTTPQLGGDLDTQGNSITGGFIMPERADHAGTPTAGSGEIWISNDATQKLMFTDDAGSDREVLTDASGSSLSTIATPAGADEVLLFDASNGSVAGVATLTDIIADVGILTTADKSGSDADVISGTAGTSGDLAVWDANGDLIDGPTPPSGAIVGTTDTQTLTNKTLTAPVLGGTLTGTYTLGGTPTFPSTVVSTTGAQTLTNKTLTSPKISHPITTDADNYTLVAGDQSGIVIMSGGSANQLTIPTNASVAFPLGTKIEVWSTGAGTTTIAGDTGVTLQGNGGSASAGSCDIQTQYGGATLTKIATNTWMVAGDIDTVA